MLICISILFALSVSMKLLSRFNNKNLNESLNWQFQKKIQYLQRLALQITIYKIRKNTIPLLIQDLISICHRSRSLDYRNEIELLKGSSFKEQE